MRHYEEDQRQRILEARRAAQWIELNDLRRGRFIEAAGAFLAGLFIATILLYHW